MYNDNEFIGNTMKKFIIIKHDYLYPYSLNNAFKSICAKGDLKEAKYVLTSPDLKIRPNLHTSDDYPFRIAYQNQHLELLMYLIVEHNLEKTQTINNYLVKNNSFSKQIADIFEKRELNQLLKVDLINNEGPNKVAKI